MKINDNNCLCINCKHLYDSECPLFRQEHGLKSAASEREIVVPLEMVVELVKMAERACMYNGYDLNRLPPDHIITKIKTLAKQKTNNGLKSDPPSLRAINGSEAEDEVGRAYTYQ